MRLFWKPGAVHDGRFLRSHKGKDYYGQSSKTSQSLSVRFIEAFLLDDDFTPLCQPFRLDLSGQDALPALPSQLEEIPESYYSKAERQGTLQNFSYDTWESFSYDAKTRPLQKHAVVYLPYGYDETKRYNVIYYMHGGGTEERPLGTVNAPSRFKNVIDRAIEDGKALPAIIVCPTYESVAVVNKLKEQEASGKPIFFDIYTNAEKAADPSKRDTGMFFFKGNPGAKFAVCNAGGGWAFVGGMQDSFSYALELSKKDTIILYGAEARGRVWRRRSATRIICGNTRDGHSAGRRGRYAVYRATRRLPVRTRRHTSAWVQTTALQTGVLCVAV